MPAELFGWLCAAALFDVGVDTNKRFRANTARILRLLGFERLAQSVYKLQIVVREIVEYVPNVVDAAAGAAREGSHGRLCREGGS